MLLSSWLQSLLGLTRRRRSKRIKTRRSQTDYVRLHVTRLEERIVLSTFNVTTFNDVIDGGDGETSLREAVIAANSDSNTDNDTINLPAGTYTLSLTGTGEDAATTGDLDLTDTTGSLTIIGAGAGQTIIDANSIDRVFHVFTNVTVNLESVTITGGTTSGEFGGGIFNVNGTVTITNSTISGNTATSSEGGGIYNTGTLAITNSILSGNSATRGGGINNEGGTVTITNSTLSGNTAGNEGGGIDTEVNGTVTITDSTLSGNTAGTSGGGIRIENSSAVTLTNSTLSGNSAGTSGGGIFNDTNGTVTITNSTITGNRADNDGNGTGAGGGIRTPNTNVTLQNTIVTGNFIGTGSTSNDINGTVNTTNSKNNLIGDSGTAGGLTNGSNGNIVGVADPKLGPLQDNGGPTATHALLVGSPAIDAGNNTGAPATDQRGLVRPQDGDRDGTAVVDIGAYEVQRVSFGPFDVLPTENGAGDFAVGDFNKDGLLDVAAAYNGSAFPSNQSIFAVFLGTGAGNFGPPTLFNPGAGGCFTGAGIETADFNNDGNLDLVMTHGGSAGGCFGNKVTVHLGDGAGGFTAPVTPFTSGGSIGNLAVGDFNEDGNVDLAIPSSDSKAVFIHPGLGNGSFAAATTLAVGESSNRILTRDLNNDGSM